MQAGRAAPGRRVIRLLAIAVSLAPASVVGASADPGLGPTVKDVVEFTRIVEPARRDSDTLQTQISPNRQHAFVITRRGDVQTDKNRFEILLLDLEPSRLAAGRPRSPEQVFAVDSTKDQYFVSPSISDARWIGNSAIVFRARIRDASFQVYRLDIKTRRLTQLTFASHPIVAFAVSDDLERVVFLARLPNPPMPPGARSLVVQNHSFWNVIHGQNDASAQKARYQYFATASGSRSAPKALGEPFLQMSQTPPKVSVSPDGRWALLHTADIDRQPEWASRYPLVAKATELAPLDLDPLNYFSRSDSYLARRLMQYRLSDGVVRPVLDAPDDALPGQSQGRMDRLWQGKGESVVIGGTHLPVATPATPDSTASHIVEYWPASGKWAVIARLEGRLDTLHAVTGEPNSFVAIDQGKRRRFRRQAPGHWLEVTSRDEKTRVAGSASAARTDWTLRFAEASNEPPNVVAVGPTGQTVKLTNLNPQYSATTWGTVRAHSWTDAKGRRWDGGLMVPNNFDARRRYPLVIQTYGFVPDKFYLDGSNVGEGYTSGFAGRAFLREHILVLALPWKASTNPPVGERAGIFAFMDGVASAVDSLVSQGLVDRERVGIMGFSATGERVNKLLTFTDVPIRAASILDGDAGTLFSMTILHGHTVSNVVLIEQANGARPYGDSVDRWVKNDPSLNTHCVNAALRIETYGPWVLNHWDTYAFLRRQYKPVEMIRIPDGNHSLSRPSERMISLQGNVDWYRFWLRGEERSEVVIPGETNASLKEQYVRWRQLAELKAIDDKKPRCPPNRLTQ